MAGLISTGIWGFICSATMKAGKITATFISGATGWIIKNNGEAEFKSIYARDKIVTNEYVYNRIRVTEDEEVVTSNGKILASFLNDDGSYNVQLDLREGDRNPFAANDLLQGYYHSPGNTGVIYAVQKMIVMEVLDDQTMNVTCLSESSPYKYMVIVRVGNTQDTDRQSFIRISSRTNCQYFYDEIASFIDLDNPDKVKCAIGKADVGLIPSWAAKVTGSVRRWFGLIADGVILRGTFVLHNDRTIEDELNSRETQLRGDFQIRDDGITGKWQEVITYADRASQSASSASDSATAAGEHEKRVEELAGEFSANAKKLSAEFSEKVTSETSNALGAITTAKDEATGSLQLTAKDFTVAFTSLVETKTTEATGAINTAKESAKSDLQLTAKNLTATFEENVQQKTLSATGEIDTATESHKSELTQTARELTTKFEQSVTDAQGEVIKEIGTQVTQNAKQWKVEVMGADKDGNPNTVLAAINADESGVQIKGDKIQITGELLANIIKTYGLNVADNFLVDSFGKVMCSNIYTAKEGQRMAITHDGPRIRIYSKNNLLLMEICASANENGEDNTYIVMHDSKNYNKWIKLTPSGYELKEIVADGTSYETVIGAGYIKMYKNDVERWSQDIR